MTQGGKTHLEPLVVLSKSVIWDFFKLLVTDTNGVIPLRRQKRRATWNKRQETKKFKPCNPCKTLTYSVTSVPYNVLFKDGLRFSSQKRFISPAERSQFDQIVRESAKASRLDKPFSFMHIWAEQCSFFHISFPASFFILCSGWLQFIFTCK